MIKCVQVFEEFRISNLEYEWQSFGACFVPKFTRRVTTEVEVIVVRSILVARLFRVFWEEDMRYRQVEIPCTNKDYVGCSRPQSSIAMSDEYWHPDELDIGWVEVNFRG